LKPLAVVGKDGRSNAANAVGVANAVDLDDLVVNDREGHHRVRLPVDGDDHTNRAVDQCRVQPRTAWAAGELRDGGYAAEHGRRTIRAKIGAQHDIRVKHLHERVEVAVAGRREEGVDHATLPREVRVRRWDLGT